MTPTSSVDRSFIFADLSGFTAMTESHGDEDAAGVALRFAEIARASLADGARLVKTIGDAVMLVVPTPELAVKTALELRNAVEREPRFPLLRTGIHHGPCAERDGDHFGAAVNLAARVAGHARAGQLLVTAVVAAAARAMDGIEVRDTGLAHFKNVVTPVNVFEINRGAHEDPATVDPVCRMRVEESNAVGRIVHEGRPFLFCSAACAKTFLEAPERYAPR